MMQLQSIVARSLLRLSGLKCERSRFLICFRLILSLVDVKIQNCEKWSLTSVMRLPLISTCSGLFTKMLSIILNTCWFVNSWKEMTTLKSQYLYLSSDLIKFKALFRQEKHSLAIACCQTHESRKAINGQSTMINFKNHNVFASRTWILANGTMPTSVRFIP